MVAGGAKIIKFLVLFFNFLFFIFGIVLLGVGAYAEVKFGDFTKLSSVDFASGSRLLIAVGVFIAVIAFFGCCGAWKENRCLLVVFFALLLVMIVVEIAGAVLAYQHRDEISSTLENDINSTIANDYGTDKVKTEAIDLLQQVEKCCGAVSWRDWVINTNYNITKVPDSCCVDETAGCGESFYDPKSPNDLSKIYQTGCYVKLSTLVRDNLKTVAGVAIAILVIQILGMVFAGCLIRKIGQEAYTSA